MARELDLFVDQMLDDVVQQWTREEDFDPAWWRNECREPWVRQRQLPECTRYYAAQRQGAPGHVLGRLRGRCRERQFVRNLCLGRISRDTQGNLQRLPRSQWPNVNAQLAGADVRQGVRVLPRDRRSPVADAIIGPLGPQGLSRGMRRLREPALEHKSMWVRHYLQGGTLNQQALQARLQREFNQVVRQRNAANRLRGVRPGMPRQHEMVYSLDGLAGLSTQQQNQVRQLIQQAAAASGVRTHILAMDD